MVAGEHFVLLLFLALSVIQFLMTMLCQLGVSWKLHWGCYVTADLCAASVCR